MRAKEFVIENDEVDYTQLINLIKKNCQPYLEVVSSTGGKPLYRGMNGFTGNAYKTYAPRPDRKPLDTPAEIHNEFNKAFVTHHGYPFRNGIFTTGDRSEAGRYGSTIAVVLPVGEPKFVWSEDISDLFYLLNHEGDGEYSNVTFGPINPEQNNGANWKVDADAIDSIVQDRYRSDDLYEAISSWNEVILANECILISQETYAEIKDALLS